MPWIGMEKIFLLFKKKPGYLSTFAVLTRKLIT
jgi:hypothetical protein